MLSSEHRDSFSDRYTMSTEPPLFEFDLHLRTAIPHAKPMTMTMRASELEMPPDDGFQSGKTFAPPSPALSEHLLLPATILFADPTP